jgi:DNA-directed RNA polymerase specialized sigma24 family protein
MDVLEARGAQVVNAGVAWDNVVAEHQRHISRLAWHLSGDMYEAQDLTQETFARAFEHRSGFRGEASIKTWLSRIVSGGTCVDRDAPGCFPITDASAKE